MKLGKITLTPPIGAISAFFLSVFACGSLFGAAKKDFYVSTNDLHEVDGVVWGSYITDDGVAHNAYTNLQQVLTYACTNNPGSTIWVENGYVLDTGATAKDGSDCRLFYTGWNNQVTVRSRSGDWRTGAEIRGDETTRCIFAQGSVAMYGMRIVGGTATNGCGGGVYTVSTYGISLYNCLIADCKAQTYGGGAYGQSNGSVKLYDCVVTNCAAGAVGNGSGSGGGMNRGYAYNCRFDRCTARGSGWDNGAGGGVSGSVTISNCVFTSCSAYNAAQINHASGQAGVGGAINLVTTVIDCWVTNCTSTAAGGGIGRVTKGANVTVFGCSAGRGGGGISGGTWTNVTIIGCVETNNTFMGSRSGGGAYNIVADDILISNCVSYAVGGGADSSTLTNAIVVCNLATNTTVYGYPIGGGLYKGTAVKSLIAGNSAICSLANRGDARYASGGGTSGTKLISCVVSNNVAWGRGGGASGGSLVNCVVADNLCCADGGGVSGASSIEGTLIVGNTANNAQGGVFNYNNQMSMVNCTVTANTNGNKLQPAVSTPTTVTNCIIWGNADVTQLSATTISHTCYPEAVAGNVDGNVSTDPKLRTVDGKEYAATSARCKGKGVEFDWMTDPADVRSKDWYGDPRILGDGPDMGWVSLKKMGMMLLLR